MATERPLFIPVILGTARQGRESEHAARFVFEQTKKRAGVESEFIDVRTLPMKLDDAGEQMKDPKFSATIERCDGLIIVTPEYNHSFPGLLKHALDMSDQRRNFKFRVRANDAVYPGGGVEGFFGPVGLRLEVGDDIYFDNGARNNIRVTFGPTIRF